MVIFSACYVFGSDEPDGKISTNTITDAVNAAITKSSALLSGNLDVEVKMNTNADKRPQEYTTNAIGQRVPKATAVKTGEALHDEAEL